MKTIRPVGPINEVPMQQSTDIAPPPSAPAEKPEDTRAPVGLDAGNPEVTDAAEDAGGWQGGAEEGETREKVEEVQMEGAPVGATVEAVEVGLDDDARRLAEEAMRDDGGT